jgi:subtilisin family serine protease
VDILTFRLGKSSGLIMTRRLSYVSCVFLYFYLQCGVCIAEPANGSDRQDDSSLISVLVGFENRDQERDFVRSSRARNEFSIKYEYKMAKAVWMQVTKMEYEELKRDQRIAYIEDDPIVYQVNHAPPHIATEAATPRASTSSAPPKRSLAEQVSYGLYRVQGDRSIPPSPDSTECQVKVCIVDSGLVIDHYDIPYTRGDGYIDGKEFGLPWGQHWYNPSLTTDHGTAVVGIIAARGGNGDGTAGVVHTGPEKSKVCLLIARIFRDDDYTTTTSRVLQAAEWCSQEGANIINFSIAAESVTQTDMAVYKQLESRGILLVAAAGNWGTEAYSYPASLDSVISVGSVNSRLRRSTFSQVNDQMELTAPGDNILTTAGTGLETFTGTSFATPYVTGIAAKLMVANPFCNADQIRQALTASAMPLGNGVPNDEFGFGVVQAWDAHNYIDEFIQTPCGGQAPSATPSVAPSSQPSAVPSLVPSVAPTTTTAPSSVPSMAPTTCQDDFQVCDDDANVCCAGLLCLEVSTEDALSTACLSGSGKRIRVSVSLISSLLATTAIAVALLF